MIAWAGQLPFLEYAHDPINSLSMPTIFQSCIILGEASRGPGNEVSVFIPNRQLSCTNEREKFTSVGLQSYGRGSERYSWAAFIYAVEGSLTDDRH